MANPVSCPVCASANVYCLLDTFHCKRCGNLWKATKERKEKKREGRDAGPSRVTKPAGARAPVQKELPAIDQKMEARLNEYLRQSDGIFCLENEDCGIGDITMALFRRYLCVCVRNGTLVERKDRQGVVWYSRSQD